MIVVVVAAFSALAFVTARSSLADGVFGAGQRMLLATGPFLAVLLGVMVTGSTLAQRGLADGADAPRILPYLAAAFGGGILAAVVSWFLLPRSRAATPVDSGDAPVRAVGSTERVVWMRRTEPFGVTAALLVAAGGILLVIGGVAVWSTAPVAASISHLAVIVVVALLVVSTMFWRVRIDESGVLVASILRVPRFRVALDEIDGAASTTINPTGDFGGWGIRWGGRGRVGVVTRAGEAIEVRRLDGRSLVVTVDDSERAAALLNGLVARRRGSSPVIR